MNNKTTLGIEHIPFLRDMYEDLWYNTRMSKTDITKTVRRAFREKYPEVQCSDSGLRRFIQENNLSPMKKQLDSKKYYDQIINLIQELKPKYCNRNKLAKDIFNQINDGGRKVTLEYVRNVVQEHWYTINLPTVDWDNFDEEWLPEYDEILLKQYRSKDCCHGANIDKYYELFSVEVGKKFDKRQIDRRIVDVIATPIPANKDLADMNSYQIRIIKGNVSAFKSRGMNYLDIAKKVLFYLQTEGYKANFNDVMNLLKEHSLITNWS